MVIFVQWAFSEDENENLLFGVYCFQDTAMSKVWFKQDDKFFLPKACLNFEFFRYVIYDLFII